jgi:hypothetical protein
MQAYFFSLILLLCVFAGSVVAQTGPSPGMRPLRPNKNKIKEGIKIGNTTPEPDPVPAEIRCRGYRGVGGGAFVFKTISTRRSVTGETIVTYEMAYSPAVKAAGADGSGLRNPGECSFSDRPISDKEPYRVRFDTVADGQIRQRQHGSTIDNSPAAAERFPDAQNIPEYLKDPKHYWSFFINGAQQGYFQATYHKYWKPGNKIIITKPDSTPGHPNGKSDIKDWSKKRH